MTEVSLDGPETKDRNESNLYLEPYDALLKKIELEDFSKGESPLDIDALIKILQENQKYSTLRKNKTEILSDSLPREIPTDPPELFRDRENAHEGVLNFILRVYRPWLNGEFTRADLEHLDPDCRLALTAFEEMLGYSVPSSELNLPSLVEWERIRSSQVKSTQVDFRVATEPASEPEPNLGKNRRGGPAVAPEKYAQRENRSENAPEFIRRVYRNWLDGDFTRADLRHLDPRCANALRNYENTNGKLSLEQLNLPTVKQRNDRLLASGELPDEPNERRRLQLVLAARRRTETEADR